MNSPNANAFSSVDKYREIVEERLPYVESLVDDYIPRILIREGISPLEAEMYTLFESEAPRSQKASPDRAPDTDLNTLGDIVLLGNAGAGKSYVLRNSYIQAAQTFLKGDTTLIPVFVELRMDRGQKGNLEEAISLHHDDLLIPVPEKEVPQVILFVDGLDEIWDIDLRRFCNGMAKTLNNYHHIIPRTIVSCRRARWESDYLKAWKASFEVYHVDYVSRATYKHIIKSESGLNDFYEEAYEKGVQPLLDVVFFGFDMARKFARGEALPTSRRHLLKERIEGALKGTEKDVQSTDTTSLENVATMLAILATFTEKREWEAGEALDSLTRSEVFRTSGFMPRLEDLESLFSRPIFIRSGKKFYFSHDFLREFLAGEALSHCSLRKQRQLLCSPLPGGLNRIPIAFRGTAIHLAEASDSFWRHLAENDSLVAALSEPVACSPEEKEVLLYGIFERTIKERRSPWWSLTERGEDLIDALRRWPPENMATFLKPYLNSEDELARVLACQCADIWGGCRKLNLDLAYIAMGEDEPETARMPAISAIKASGDKKTFRAIDTLLSSSNDRVRGEALAAFRELEKPSPSLFLSKLEGGKSYKHYVGTLHMEAIRWGQELSANQVSEAFGELERRIDKLGDLVKPLLRGLLDGASKLEPDAIPAQAVFRLCIERDHFLPSERNKVKELFGKDVGLRFRVWKFSLDAIKYHKKPIYLTLSDYFAPFAEEILGILPKTKQGLSRKQNLLIEYTLVGWLNRDSASEKLLMIQNRAPAWMDLPSLHKESPKAEGGDPLEEKEMLISALRPKNSSSITKTYNLLVALSRILRKREAKPDLEDDPKKIVDHLNNHPDYLKQRVVDTFEECVNSVSYGCQKININTIKRTQDWLATPFYVLIELDRMPPLQKMAEVLRCFAFTDHTNAERDRAFLDMLRKEDEGLWRNCLLGIMDDKCPGGESVLEYLRNRKSEIYISRCREMLNEGSFRDYPLHTLCNYWSSLEPDDYLDVLWACYLKLRQPISVDNPNWQQFQLLCTLVSRDHDGAIRDLQQRLSKHDLPVAREMGRPWWDGPLSTNPDVLPTLADWYTLSMNRNQERRMLPEDISSILMSSILEIGGQKAIQELQRLIDENAYPGAEWLGYYIMQIEEKILKEAMKPRSEAEVLDFVCKERAGLVESDRDLYESTRQTIEEVKKAIELRGEGAAGFWNVDKKENKREPKPEVECQNVLWPSLRTRLESYGISVPEEVYIGPNKADLLLEKRDNEGNVYRVILELKVARKGYGYQQLIDPLETQLYEEYMIPRNCKFGIYTILWCKENEYDFPTHWGISDDLLKDIEAKAEEIRNKARVSIACYVIDITKPYRKH